MVKIHLTAEIEKKLKINGPEATAQDCVATRGADLVVMHDEVKTQRARGHLVLVKRWGSVNRTTDPREPSEQH